MSTSVLCTAHPHSSPKSAANCRWRKWRARRSDRRLLRLGLVTNPVPHVVVKYRPPKLVTRGQVSLYVWAEATVLPY